MFEQIILGVIQGIFEWLPVSSEGIIVLIEKNFFNNQAGVEEIIKYALFLHLGTFLAALIYFYKDVLNLIKALFNFKTANAKVQEILKFLIISSLIGGFFGFVLMKVFSGLEEQLELSARIITLIVGLLLLVTGLLQIRAKKTENRGIRKIGNKDSILLGFVQALAALPGLSRSGLTVSALLLRKFNSATALKLSFLMSLPMVLGGNIILNLNNFTFSLEMFLGLAFSFIFGLLTISLLLKIARKINFGYFVLVFGVVVLLSLVKIGI
ncbi:MAG: undecaprenyl-diphosphate phosphatase [Patescibacteria group bacterium]